MKGSQRIPKIGEVYLIDFDGCGCGQSGTRPGIVFQNNVGNKYSPNIIALPLTSVMKKLNQPTHILIKAEESGLKRDSVVLCENPQCVSKERVGKYLTTLPQDVMKRVAIGSMIATGTLSLLDLQTLVNAWYEADCADRNYA